jgi:two-component system LytT family response regulator
MKLRSIIIDDEEPARENLKILLEDFCPEIQLIGMADNIVSAKKMIQELKPEVIFLDIRMPSGLEGFELLESLPDKNFMVVFVTAFKEYAIKAFNANAIHYILKPIDIEELKTAVKKILQWKENIKTNPENLNIYLDALKNLSENLIHKKNTGKITISHSKGIKIVNDDDIIHINADSNYSVIHFKDGSHFFDTRTLGVYEEILNPNKFFRTHKSHIINLNELVEYQTEHSPIAILKNGHKIPVARNRIQEFVAKIKSL